MLIVCIHFDYVCKRRWRLEESILGSPGEERLIVFYLTRVGHTETDICSDMYTHRKSPPFVHGR